MKRILLVCIILVSVIFQPQRLSLAEIELSDYFTGYAELESNYGEYKSDWPILAKVSFVKLLVAHALL